MRWNLLLFLPFVRGVCVDESSETLVDVGQQRILELFEIGSNASTCAGKSLPTNANAMGHSMANIDLNGDGIMDLAIGAPSRTFTDTGALHGALLRNDSSIDSFFQFDTSAQTGSGSSIAAYGRAVANVGDVNDDGQDDLMVSYMIKQYGEGQCTGSHQNCPGYTQSECQETTGIPSLCDWGLPLEKIPAIHIILVNTTHPQNSSSALGFFTLQPDNTMFLAADNEIFNASNYESATYDEYFGYSLSGQSIDSLNNGQTNVKGSIVAIGSPELATENTNGSLHVIDVYANTSGTLFLEDMYLHQGSSNNHLGMSTSFGLAGIFISDMNSVSHIPFSADTHVVPEPLSFDSEIPLFEQSNLTNNSCSNITMFQISLDAIEFVNGSTKLAIGTNSMDIYDNALPCKHLTVAQWQFNTSDPQLRHVILDSNVSTAMHAVTWLPNSFSSNTTQLELITADLRNGYADIGTDWTIEVRITDPYYIYALFLDPDTDQVLVAQLPTCTDVDETGHLYINENVPGKHFIICMELKTVEFGPDCEEIGDKAFERSGLVTVIIPATVTDVGDSAFENCDDLVSATVNQNTSDKQFLNCDALQTIEIAAGCTEISPGSFRNTTLTTLVIPDTVAEVGKNAFNDCINLVSATVNQDVALGQFEACTSLATVEFGEGCTKIGESAFYNTALVTLNIPATVISVDYGAFSACADLVSATVNQDVVASQFSECTSLATVEFGEGCTTIANHVFENSKISKIVIPATVETVSSGSFVTMDDLETVVLPTDLCDIDMFYNEGGRRRLLSSDGLYNIGNFTECPGIANMSYITTLGEVPEECNATVSGCTDLLADNYNPDATTNNDSCTYRCAIVSSLNFYTSSDCTEGTKLLNNTIELYVRGNASEARVWKFPSVYEYGSFNFSNGQCENRSLDVNEEENFGAFEYGTVSCEKPTTDFTTVLSDSEDESCAFYHENLFTETISNPIPSNPSYLDYVNTTCTSYGTLYTKVTERSVCCGPPVLGCMDSIADNYNADATEDDGSCEYTCPIVWSSSIYTNMEDCVNNEAVIQIAMLTGNETSPEYLWWPKQRTENCNETGEVTQYTQNNMTEIGEVVYSCEKPKDGCNFLQSDEISYYSNWTQWDSSVSTYGITTADIMLKFPKATLSCLEQFDYVYTLAYEQHCCDETTPAPPSPPPPEEEETESDTSSGLGTAAIAGISGGAGVVVLGLAYFFWPFGKSVHATHGFNIGKLIF